MGCLSVDIVTQVHSDETNDVAVTDHFTQYYKDNPDKKPPAIEPPAPPSAAGNGDPTGDPSFTAQAPPPPPPTAPADYDGTVGSGPAATAASNRDFKLASKPATTAAAAAAATGAAASPASSLTTATNQKRRPNSSVSAPPGEDAGRQYIESSKAARVANDPDVHAIPIPFEAQAGPRVRTASTYVLSLRALVLSLLFSLAHSHVRSPPPSPTPTPTQISLSLSLSPAPLSLPLCASASLPYLSASLYHVSLPPLFVVVLRRP